MSGLAAAAGYSADLAAGLAAQADAADTPDRGHFVDSFVDTVTNLEIGDTVVNAVARTFEFAVTWGLLVVPALLVVFGLMRRRPKLTAGSAVFGVLAAWYRFGTDDWDQRQNTFLDTWVIPVGDWVEQTTRWVDLNMTATLDVVEWPFRALLNVIVNDWLLQLSWLTVCLGVFFLGWTIRNLRVGIVSFLGLAICGLLGDDYWLETARTIGFIGVAVLLCVIIGVPVGVLCGRVDGAWTVVRPVLDAMQVVHSFVYMLPFIFFFGIGFVSATMVTMVFALPPLIRLTNLGIRQVPEDVVEAARAYGAPERRVLIDVQLPLARPALMAGLNQTMLLSISMLGIAAIMGAGGLGRLLFQAISNLDIALAGSGGLAFFLVAVVLDRLSQPETGDSGNLLSRIGQAWAHRRDPELLLVQQQVAAEAAEKAAAAAAAGSERASAPRRSAAVATAEYEADEEYVVLSGAERLRVGVIAVASVATLLAVVLLPWARNAGALSSYGRTADLDLAGQSFNGVAASGGSWFGIFVLLATATALAAALNSLLHPGRVSRWLGPDDAMIFSTAALVGTLGYVLAAPHDAAVGFTTGVGAYAALAASAVAAAAAMSWTVLAPMTARNPLSSRIAAGKIAAAAFAVLMLVAAGYSGWSYDTRSESVITPELQSELDAIATEARAAEASGDLALAGVLAAELTSKISEAQRTGDVVWDGFTSEGAGLGLWSLLLGLVALALVLPAAGVFGIEESRLYRWSAPVGGLGLGLAVIGGGWIMSLVRTADTNFVSGMGAVLVLLAGVVVFSTVKSTLSDFERNKQYQEIVPETQRAPAPLPEEEKAAERTAAELVAGD
ncbi:MAG TPA: hypothetical protein DEP66_01235 [Acidimicrobiaceae bacterium]|nr:hypothetical protein [Acidimicrobiaceae bacterium]HCB36862.1 hypothetical protein [Acidimicrobiaceae bacterium]